MAKTQVSMTVNGKAVEALVEPRTLLIHFLREQLNLTGPHIGCDTSHCGACTVDLDGKSVKSCTVFAVQANGADIRTIEGMANADGTLHALQEGFREMHGLQCGFCTPGMIMRAYRLLQENPSPTRGGDPLRHFRQSLPLHRLPEHRQGHSVRRRQAQRRAVPGGRRMNDHDPHLRRARRTSSQGMGCKRKRVEDIRFVQGKGNYVDDLKLPGMLYGDFTRSPHAPRPHQERSTPAKAAAVPGVVAVLTADDLKPSTSHWMPTLAGDVQAVLADEQGAVTRTRKSPSSSPRTATSRPTPPTWSRSSTRRCRSIVDPLKAMAPDAPVIREDIKDKTDGAPRQAQAPQPHLHLADRRQGGDRRRLRARPTSRSRR